MSIEVNGIAHIQLTVNHPELSPEVLNQGIPSETVSGLSEPGHLRHGFPRPDLHERLDRALKALKPDLIIACYGINCGIYQPFDEGRFAEYGGADQRSHLPRPGRERDVV